MPQDRLNVYDSQLQFRRFIDLHYPTSFGAGFHLSRIQGAKVIGHTMYATRDDDTKTVYAIDLSTTLVPTADLQITKTDNAASAVPGVKVAE